MCQCCICISCHLVVGVSHLSDAWCQVAGKLLTDFMPVSGSQAHIISQELLSQSHLLKSIACHVALSSFVCTCFMITRLFTQSCLFKPGRRLPGMQMSEAVVALMLLLCNCCLICVLRTSEAVSTMSCFKVWTRGKRVLLYCHLVRKHNTPGLSTLLAATFHLSRTI